MCRRTPYPNIFPLTALFFLAFLSLELYFSDGAQANPRLAIARQIHDFRNVLEGEILSHTFELLNAGDEPLVIERVKPDCSCSVVDFDSPIPPKAAGNMTVRIDTKGFDGSERWVVKIFSNDPNWSEATLDLRANVTPVITLSGTAVVFSGRKKSATSQEIEITTGLDRPLILTPLQFTLPGKVAYSLSEIVKEKTYRVTFQNVAGTAENYRGVLKLRTNFPEKPEVTIWIVGRFEN